MSSTPIGLVDVDGPAGARLHALDRPQHSTTMLALDLVDARIGNRYEFFDHEDGVGRRREGRLDGALDFSRATAHDD